MKEKCDKIKQTALNYLARRDHTEKELAQKLKAKGYTSEEIRATLDSLVQSRLLDDRRFVENFVRWRCTKGFGPERIKAELNTRGVAASIIADALSMTDNTWVIEARKLWKKHFKGIPAKDYKSRVKQMRYLQYRGYTREQIESVIISSDDFTN